MLRIRDVFPGSRIGLISIPDPGSELFPSRIRIKELVSTVFLTQKKWFLSSRKYDLGWSFRIPDADPDFIPIPDPGSRGQKGTGSWIRNTGYFHFNNFSPCGSGYGWTDLIRIRSRSLPSIGSVWIRAKMTPDKESKLRIRFSVSLYASPEAWMYLNSSWRKNILPFFLSWIIGIFFCILIF